MILLHELEELANLVRFGFTLVFLKVQRLFHFVVAQDVMTAARLSTKPRAWASFKKS